MVNMGESVERDKKYMELLPYSFYCLHYLLGRRRGHNLFVLSFTKALVCTILGKKLPVAIQ